MRARKTHSGADEGTRTHDLCFTKALLYQLSYIGLSHVRRPAQIHYQIAAEFSIALNKNEASDTALTPPYIQTRIPLAQTPVLWKLTFKPISKKLIFLLKCLFSLIRAHVKYVVEILLHLHIIGFYLSNSRSAHGIHPRLICKLSMVPLHPPRH